MRCKPGDLAVIIRAKHPENVGRLVTVVRLNDDGLWLVEGKGPGIYCRDENLRPIRDPGDDATDEMVERVGKPQEVTA